jgi:hypothetical protein
MVLFGETRRYLSHVPMFRRPHDAQVVLEVQIPGGPFVDGLYTLEPERFDLDTLVRGERTSFRGTIWRGSFEDGGTPLAKDVTVTVIRVIYARDLKDESARSEEAPAFLLFGEPRDAYLVRRIARAPGIDEIVRAKVAPASGLDWAGVEVTVFGRGPARLSEGESLRASTRGAAVTVEVDRVLSCLVGPDFDKPCPH